LHQNAQNIIEMFVFATQT